MLFPSLEFLYFFFPVTIGVYYLLPNPFRNYWLLICSLFFYAWGEPKFVFFMIGSICFNYLMALRIEELTVTWQRKLFLAVSVIGNLSLITVFKYLNFITSNLRRFSWAKESVPQTDFVLPIGISFFTFQAMSYVIDVYRGIPAQKNPAYIGLYISFFPQLIAGPIVRYTTIMDQISGKREFEMNSFSEGIFRFLCGFNKKMLLANAMAEIADAAFATKELSFCFAWLGAIAYSLQIYFDFSGYSDMAIGLGKMFGFHFLENFHYPYISKTVSEFWRRWHISLSSWFRDYVYFPMGGSRVSKGRIVRNLFVVWLLTGIWHGANWTFIAWGVYYGIIITVEKMTDLEQRLKNHPRMAVLYRVITITAFICGWVMFRSNHFMEGLNYIKTMFIPGNGMIFDATFAFYLREYVVPLTAGILLSLPLWKTITEKLKAQKNVGGYRAWIAATAVLQLLLFWISISHIVMNQHNPFIYFNF